MLISMNIYYFLTLIICWYFSILKINEYVILMEYILMSIMSSYHVQGVKINNSLVFAGQVIWASWPIFRLFYSKYCSSKPILKCDRGLMTPEFWRAFRGRLPKWEWTAVTLKKQTGWSHPSWNLLLLIVIQWNIKYLWKMKLLYKSFLSSEDFESPISPTSNILRKIKNSVNQPAVSKYIKLWCNPSEFVSLQLEKCIIWTQPGACYAQAQRRLPPSQGREDCHRRNVSMGNSRAHLCSLRRAWRPEGPEPFAYGHGPAPTKG